MASSTTDPSAPQAETRGTSRLFSAMILWTLGSLKAPTSPPSQGGTEDRGKGLTAPRREGQMGAAGQALPAIVTATATTSLVRMLPCRTSSRRRPERKRTRTKKKPQFEEEDFPSLNPEPGKQVTPNKQTGTPTGVWENPPSSKQPLKMLVIKKISKEDPSAFSAAFASPVPHLSNGNSKSNPSGPIIYKNLVPKPASASSKGTASVTPPLELSISRLTRMTRRVPDKKSEFLKALKDEQDADQTEDRDRDKLEDVQNQSPTELNNGDGEHIEGSRHLNGISDSLEDQRGRLSYSLEAEHRLLKEMGWQESPENDDDCLPLTEEELQEFQIKSQQLKRHGLGLNGFLRQPRRCALFAWRSPLTPDPSSETDSSSSDTSDDES